MPVCLYNTPWQEFEQKQLNETRTLEHTVEKIPTTQENTDEFSEGVAINDILAAQQSDCESMPCWYYDKKELRNTPSIRDGLSLETERRYRKEGARFIMSCGTQMGLGHNTMATGVVYFHRFYMFHSFRTFPRYVTACCCLFLAGKVEETPKKCRDVIKTARALLDDNHFYSFGEDPKEEVMTLERVLLQTIKFDLQVEHPYSYLLKYAKCFKGDQQKLQKMVQMAWNFVNDSLSTTVCLQWEPEIIAVALIHLASKLSKFIVNDWDGREPHHTRWWDMFVEDVTMEILEDICHQVLDLYQKNQKDETDGANSPPQKPPSRADSPTPLVKKPYNSPQQHVQPTPVVPPQQKETAYQQAAHYEAKSVPPTADVQTIKSVAGNTHSSRYPANTYYHSDIYTPPPLPPQGMHVGMQYTATPPPPPPPPPPHSVLNLSNATRSVPLPPLPPMPPPGFYGHMPVMPAMPPTNSSAPSQYNRASAGLLPPPPAPPAVPNGSSNHIHDDYYHHTHHQAYQPHAPHHSSHRGRHHRRTRRY